MQPKYKTPISPLASSFLLTKISCVLSLLAEMNMTPINIIAVLAFVWLFGWWFVTSYRKPSQPEELFPEQRVSVLALCADDLLYLSAMGETCGWSQTAVRLHKHGLLEPVKIRNPIGEVIPSFYDLQKSPIGVWAAKGVFVNGTVAVSDDYHIPFMRGKIGKVHSIREMQIDAVGHDEYGYVNRIPHSTAVAEVKFPDEHGTWCFYKITDLI
jgi:hypothetical protein